MLKRERILEDGNVYTRSSVNSSQLHARLSNNRSNLRPRDRIRKPDATIQRGNQTETRANTRHSTAKPYARSASDPKVFPSCRVENPKAETIVSSQVLVFPFVGISFPTKITSRLLDQFFLSNDVLKMSSFTYSSNRRRRNVLKKHALTSNLSISPRSRPSR